MFARGLTCCTILILAGAAGCLARTVWAEWRWFDDLPLASLFVSVIVPAYALSPLPVLGLVGWMARRRWLAAFAVLLAAVWVSVVTVYCWGVAEPSGPDGEEALGILRMLAMLAVAPAILVAMLIVALVVPAAERSVFAESGAAPDPAA